MFGVPEREVLETYDQPRPLAGDHAAELRYNQSERGVFRDGVDRIAVIPLGGLEERYLLSYTGSVSGSLVVTRAGLEAMGEAMLGDRDAVPRWLLSPGDDTNAPPTWVPESYEPAGAVSCGACGADASASRVVTRDGRDDPAGYRCPDCWEGPPL